MFEKIDIRDLVRDHLGTLISYRTKRPSALDFILFYGVPAAASGVAAWRCIQLSDNVVNLLINALAILGGLLFNLLVLVHGLTRAEKGPTGKEEARLMLQSVYSNVAYAILIALIALLPLVLLASTHAGINQGLSAFVIFLTLHFALTLLMILKRIHAVLKYEFCAPEAK